MRWVSHAMHPRDYCSDEYARRLTGPDLIEPRIGSTGADANRWEPSEAARLIPTSGTLKVPLTPD
jgi:hypothetical protein